MAKRDDSGFAGRLAELRLRIDQLATAIEGAENAPLDVETAHARAERWVDLMMDQCPIDVGEFTMTDGQRWTTFREPINAAAFAAWIDPTAAKQRLRRAIDEYYAARKTEPLSSAQRRDRIKKCKDDLFELELAEERLIREAEAGGVELERRGNANPFAILKA